MSKAKTYVTEISMAKGILGKPLDDANSGVGKLTSHQHSNYLKYLEENKDLANQFHNIGKTISEYLINEQTPISLVDWTGQDRVSHENQIAAQDIRINDFIPISVKENSHVMMNGSPKKIFEHLPAGSIQRNLRITENWFESIALEELSSYYLACAKHIPGSSQTYSDFSKKKKKEQKEFGRLIKELHDKNIEEVIDAYKKLCKKVSEKSVEIFNEIFNKSGDDVKYTIFKELFRIDNNSYILAGTEDDSMFACKVPSWDEWSKKYSLELLTLSPAGMGQANVYFHFLFKDLQSNELFEKSVKAEIRWSHGKFCGCPESKIYKKWSYLELPWIKRII